MISTKNVAAGIISIIGLLLALIHVVHIVDTDEAILVTVVGSVIPLCGALALVFLGYWWTRQNRRKEQSLHLVQWTVLGGLTFGLFSGFVGLYQYVADQLPENVEFYLAISITGGTLAGGLLGVYNVRSKRREAYLEETNQSLTMALHASNAGVWSWDLKANELTWDDGMTQLLGINPVSFPGTYESFLTYIHPEDRPAVQQNVAKALAEGRKRGTRSSELQVEFRVTASDQRVTWITFIGQLLTDYEGTPERMIGVAIDTSTQKRQKKRFETLVERSTDIITVLDDEGRFTYQSPSVEHILGYEPEDVLGEEVFEYVHPDHRERVRTEFEKAIENPNETPVVEYKLLDANGEWRWLESRGNNQLDNPAVEGIIVNSRDITRRREYEQQLKTQRDNLEVLNKIVRHDIKNDLMPILGYSDILSGQVRDELQPYVERMNVSTQSAIDTTETAAKVAKITLRDGVDPFPVSIAAVLEDELETAQAEYKNAEISCLGSVPDTEVFADKMLASVFENLIENAIEHNDKQTPTVTIEAMESEDVVEIHIADNGPGISEYDAGVVFDEGEKGANSNGSGLGLFLVDSLVDRYGGEIRIEETDPTGTIFVVCLRKVK